MNKKECFRRLWNNIEDSIPDDNPNLKILIETENGVSITTGELLSVQQFQMKDPEFAHGIRTQKTDMRHTGYFCKRWMIIHL